MKNALILLWLATSCVHAFSVQVESSQAQPIELSVSALGSVTSEVEATVRLRTEGIVQALNVQAGESGPGSGNRPTGHRGSSTETGPCQS